MTTMNRRIVLAARPKLEAALEHFRMETVPLPEVGPDQVLVRHHFLSLDPYMRGRMSEAKSYAAPQPLDQVMIGGTVGEVVQSRHPNYQVGDRVAGYGGWQEYSLVEGPALVTLQKVDTRQVPLSAYLGPVGMPGITAWYGLSKICEAKPGETVAVSAAAGAVGSVVGQLAKMRGCRAIGIAGGRDKCAYVVEELGFDACVDYKAAGSAEALSARLAEVAPKGIDAYFENVGGLVLDAVLPQMNAFGRIAVCGMIAGYEGAPVPIKQPTLILRSRLKMQGFIVFEQPDTVPWAQAELASAVASGRIKYRETIAEGLENAPAAFLGLLKGRNLGKQLVRLL
jgi:hypothetical protein